MTCETFREYVVDLSRGELMDADLRRELELHEETCGDCAAALRDQEALGEGLKALRDAMPVVFDETAALIAFRRQASAPKRIYARWVPAAVAAAAAVVLLWRAAAPPTVNRDPVVATPHIAAAPAATEIKPAVAEKPAPTPRPRRFVKKPPVLDGRPHPAIAVSAGDRFIPVPFAPALSAYEHAQVIRVRLPRSSIRSLGLPVSEDRAMEQIEADILLGQDGIARAVRFVK